MVIVQLKGGLGNQLFQYAAALSLAVHHNTTVKVDVGHLGADEAIKTFRNYELQYLLEPPEIATVEELKKVAGSPLVQKLQKLLPSYKRKVFNEKHFKFDRHFFAAQPNVYLKGYRQSELYFSSIEDQIRHQFRLQPLLTQKVADWAKQLSQSNSVSVHVRRGDYTLAAVNNFHGFPGAAYYLKAIAAVTQRVSNPKFYVFSDDPAWVKANLQLPNDAVFMSANVTETAYHDFYLMQNCRNNIIANSSFSWWAAWLNPYPAKTIVAPQQWFNNNLDTKDIIPPGWLKV